VVTARIPAGYTVRKIYVIICDKCNEDITRTLSGEDVATRDDALAEIAEHEKVFHGMPGPDSPADAAARSWAGWADPAGMPEREQ
jgi:hypothetical protein